MKAKPKAKRNARAPKVSQQPEPSPMYSLHLYITGQTPRSAGSVQNLKQVCDKYLAGRFELEVIDIYQQPELARKAQIIAAPTLIKSLPLPLRRLVGDLSSRQRVLRGLDLKEEIEVKPEAAQETSTEGELASEKHASEKHAPEKHAPEKHAPEKHEGKLPAKKRPAGKSDDA